MAEAIIKRIDASSRPTPKPKLPSHPKVEIDIAKMKDVYYVVYICEIHASETELHEQPDKDSPVIKSLAYGEIVDVVSHNGFWGIPIPGGRLGWVNSDDVHRTGLRILRKMPRTKTTPKWALDNDYHERLNTLIRTVIDTPFVEKGTSEIGGIDAWNLICRFADIAGEDLRPDMREQTGVGSKIGLSYIESGEWDEFDSGDRLYFDIGGTGTINHSGIYIADGYFIHASPSAGKVIISRLSDKVFRSSFVVANRDISTEE